MTSVYDCCHSRIDIRFKVNLWLIVADFLTPNYLKLADKFLSKLKQYKFLSYRYTHDKITRNWDRKSLIKPSARNQVYRDYPNNLLILLNDDNNVKDRICSGLDSVEEIADLICRKPMTNRMVLKIDDIPIHSNKNQTYNFNCVDDLIATMIKMIDTRAYLTGTINFVISKEFSMLQLAKKLIQLNGSKRDIGPRLFLHENPMDRKLEISLKINEMDWKSIVKLADDFKKKLPHFSNLS